MKPLHKIAYFDDDKENLNFYSELLVDKYKVETFQNPFHYEAGIQPDLSAILIDVLMPGMDGHELFMKIKDHPNYNNCPIIFISADNSEEIKMKSLDFGCTDFLHRIMKKEELVLRLNNRISSFHNSRTIFQLSNLKVDISELKVYLSGKLVDVTLTELKIIKMLIKNFPQVTSREDITTHVWPGMSVQATTINTHLTNIRAKTSKWNYELVSIKQKGIQLVEKEK